MIGPLNVTTISVQILQTEDDTPNILNTSALEEKNAKSASFGINNIQYM
jgi:hypothetical protein